jgi:O-antigen/teichoic acid export membrane protein
MKATDLFPGTDKHMFYWRVILRNIFSNWTGYLLTAVISFMLAPFLVQSLGKTAYGLWALILSFTGYFSLLDLGVRSSVGRFVARYLALDDNEKANRTVSTAFAILATGGLLAMLLTVAVVVFLFDRFHVGPELAAGGRIALLLLGVNIAFSLPMGVFNSVLVALERFDVINAVTVVGELVRALLVVATVKLGYGLAPIAGVMLLLSIAQYTAVAIFVRHYYPGLRGGLRFIDRATFRNLFSFGVFRFIWILANQLIFYSDTVVIGLSLGASAVTYYAVAGSLMNTGRNFVSLVTDTFTAAASRMDATEDIEGLQRLLIVGTRMALLIALPLCMGFFFLGRQFMILWIGPEFVASAVILAILTVPQIASMSQYTSSTVLGAMAKHRILAYTALAEGVANLVLSLILVRKFGLIGVAWGTVIPHLVTTVFIVPLYTVRIVGLSPREYLLKAYLRPVLCALPVAALCYAFSINVRNPTWLLFGTEVAMTVTVFAALSYFVCLEPEQRASLLNAARQPFVRERVVNEA